MRRDREKSSPCNSEYVRFEPPCSSLIRPAEVPVPEWIRMAIVAMRDRAMPDIPLFFYQHMHGNNSGTIKSPLSQPPFGIDRIKVLKFSEAVGCRIIL
ncbi:MAG: hypothetical protein E4G89_03135, partial [Methanothrix sp.]